MDTWAGLWGSKKGWWREEGAWRELVQSAWPVWGGGVETWTNGGGLWAVRWSDGGADGVAHGHVLPGPGSPRLSLSEHSQFPGPHYLMSSRYCYYFRLVDVEARALRGSVTRTQVTQLGWQSGT